MIKLNSNTEMTPVLIKKIIDKFQQLELPRLINLGNYYETKNQILNRMMADETKPNNKIANPYANYITDTLVGYFMGEPVSYSSLDPSIVEQLSLIFEYNDEADENVELARDSSVYGVSYELVYTDIDGATRFKKINPTECIPVYDDTIENDLLYFIRFYTVEDLVENKTTVNIEVYSKNDIKYYTASETMSGITLVREEPHYFGLVPVAIYKNNELMMGDFEAVISLIDAYDKLESDSLNDFEYFCDAYLALTGFNAESEDISKMKQNRVLLLDKDSDAKWLIKDEQDTMTENIKTRIDKDIHKFAKCPNLADTEFASNASGVAIKYKMIGTENLVAVKERKFKKGLQRRIELIAAIDKLKVGGFDWRAIDIIFNRNLPSNDTEIATMVNTLSGIVSNETLLAQIPFVENVQDEVKRVDKEKESNPFYDMRLGYKNEVEENEGEQS